MIDKIRLIEWILMALTIISLLYFSVIAFEAKKVCEDLEKVEKNRSVPTPIIGQLNISQTFG